MASPDYSTGRRWDEEQYHHDDVPYYRPDFNRGNYNRLNPGAGFAWTGRFPANQVRGPHTGHGPRNYRRSDARILDDVSAALAQNGGLDASDIYVAVNDGEVQLTGSVKSRQQKRLAGDLSDSIPGVQDVQNELRINRD